MAEAFPPLASGPEPLRDDAGLRVWRIAGETSRLVVCFSGVGVASDASPPPEFQRLAGHTPRDHLLFIADPARSWLNRNGIVAEIVSAIEAEAARIGATQICTLGHSMGGFSALVLPAFTKVDVAVAMSPQYAVDPAIVPAENRWREWRDRIADFHIGDVTPHLQASGQYFVFFGRHPRELVQRERAVARDNLDLFILPHTHHNTSQRMKEAGILDQVLQACFSCDRPTVETLLYQHLKGRKAALPAAPAP